jgi:uncharacterized protein
MHLIQRHTTLSANVVAFCRYLRTEGYAITATEEADALKTLEIIEPYDEPGQIRLAMKACLVRTQGQAERFEELYDWYWKQVEKAVDSKIAQGEPEAKKNGQKPKPKPNEPQFQALKDWLYGNQENEEEVELYTYSAAESLSKKDFSMMTADELQAVFQLIQAIARRLARLKNRRFKKDKNGVLDLRKTLRQNLRRGGEMLDLVRKKPQKRKIRLVLLCDVSKSMELYSRFLIQFAYAFQQVFSKIDTFVFSTKLEKISHLLRGGDFEKVLKEIGENVTQWSGGTRIGESLQTYLDDYAPKSLNSKTVVLILSDGWDTGDLDILDNAMHVLHKKAYKIIWLNPLAGNAHFEAAASGMATALPYINVFASAHNVESLRRVVGRF